MLYETSTLGGINEELEDASIGSACHGSDAPHYFGVGDSYSTNRK
jgi:hypothetical protein